MSDKKRNRAKLAERPLLSTTHSKESGVLHGFARDDAYMLTVTECQE